MRDDCDPAYDLSIRKETVIARFVPPFHPNCRCDLPDMKSEDMRTPELPWWDGKVWAVWDTRHSRLLLYYTENLSAGFTMLSKEDGNEHVQV